MPSHTGIGPHSEKKFYFVYESGASSPPVVASNIENSFSVHPRFLELIDVDAIEAPMGAYSADDGVIILPPTPVMPPTLIESKSMENPQEHLTDNSSGVEVSIILEGIKAPTHGLNEAEEPMSCCISFTTIKDFTISYRRNEKEDDYFRARVALDGNLVTSQSTLGEEQVISPTARPNTREPSIIEVLPGREESDEDMEQGLLEELKEVRSKRRTMTEHSGLMAKRRKHSKSHLTQQREVIDLT
ncbi:hypothetical protein BDN70DRAFT_932415 [Pholiota conissans]|uniref:Uncharacterized protein n=1 Tax=Pholiota conissans TaxID=109636 RepID=A0A9P5Z1W1_9AGAR|nr:hypothetical protein BDN70DRAFT_932415 [Pholiota conissans]